MVDHRVGDVAQAVGVADRNQALHAQGLGARGNALKLGDADIAGFMQVDIDFNAMPLSDAEDDIQLGVSVAVQGGGVDAANHLSPFADSGLHDLGGARAGDHAGLGKATSSMSSRCFQLSRASSMACGDSGRWWRPRPHGNAWPRCRTQLPDASARRRAR